MAEKVIGFRISLGGEQETITKLNTVKNILTATAKALDDIAKNSVAANANLSKIADLVAKIAALQNSPSPTTGASNAYEKPITQLSKYIAELERARVEQQRLDAGLDALKGKLPYDELVKQVAQAKAEQKALTAEIKAQQREFEQMKVAVGSYRDLDLQLQKLRETYRNLSAEERKANGKELLKDISALDKELKQIDASMGQYQRNVGNYVSAFGRIAPVVTGLAASLGVLSSASDVIQGNAKVSDSIADIQRVSKLSKEQVTALYDELRNIGTGDTISRTSIEDLLGISVIGGKLGVAEKDLTGFVKAADALKVGLGGELGSNIEETTTKLGKLANIFSPENDKSITGDKLLNIGNAIVVLANKGVASGEFLADFSNRLAGLSGIANVTLPQTLGLGAGFEELGQSAEVASTATTQLVLKIGQDVPKYAKLAGKSTEEFAATVQANPVEALIQLSQGLTKNKTGFAEIAESFKEAEAKGVRVGATLGVLGKNADFFRAKIEDGTKAYQSQNDILDAYKTKNETAGAALDRLKKTVIDITTGVEFQAWLYKIIGAVTDLIRIIGGLPRLLSENKTEFIALAFAIAALNREAIIAQIAAIKLSSAYQFLTDATKRQAIVTEVLGNAQKALPFLFVVAAVYTAVKAFGILKQNYDSLTVISRTLAEVQSEITQEYSKEAAVIAANFTILKAENTTKQEKKRVVDELLKRYPDYLNGIDLEKASITQLNAIQDNLNASIKQGVLERVKANKVQDLFEKQINNEARINELQSRKSEGFGALTNTEQLRFVGVGTLLKNDAKTAVNDIIKGYQEENERLGKTIVEVQKNFTGVVNGSQSVVNSSDLDGYYKGSSGKAKPNTPKTPPSEGADAAQKARDRAAKAIQKETTERINYEEHAAERIAQLRKGLADKTFELQKGEVAANYAESLRKAGFERDEAVKKLSGTSEAVAKEKAIYDKLYNEEAKLIKLNLTQKIDAINEARQAAEEAAAKELASTRQGLNIERSQNTVTNIKAVGAADTRVARLDEIKVNADFTGQEKTIRDQYAAKGLITEGEERQLAEKLTALEFQKSEALLAVQKRTLELSKAQKQNELNAQIQLLADQREKELTEIDERETAKREKLDSYLAEKLITTEQYQQGLKDIEATAIEERGRTDTDFEIAKAEFAQTVAVDYLDEQQRLADSEVKINADKNAKMLENDKKTKAEQRAINDAKLEFLGTFVSGAKSLLEQDTANRKKYGAVIKALALAEIAINLSKELSSLAVAAGSNVFNTVTFGVAGATQYSIQSAVAIARAGFAAAKVVGQQFEYGGIEPTHRSDGIAAIGGGSIPTESGVIQGRSHTEGGVRVQTKRGNFYEVEGGEYRLRNGNETYIINRKSTGAFRSELDTLSKLIRPNVFNPSRKAAAAAINGNRGSYKQQLTAAAISGYPTIKMPKFALGGTVLNDGSIANSVFDTYLLPAPSAAKPSQIVVNSITQTDGNILEAIAQLAAMTNAVNNRIDRIAVINNPSDALDAATENAVLKSVQSL